MRFAFLLLALSFPAFAAETLVPEPDPEGYWRAITQSDDTTQSPCIGKPHTPLCAVETHLACYVRRDDPLCWEAAMPADVGMMRYRTKPSPGVVERYRIYAAKRIKTGDDIPERWRTGARAWQTGDVVIGIQSQPCYDSIGRSRCGSYIGPPVTYVLRELHGRWLEVMRFTYNGDHWELAKPEWPS